MIGRLTLNKRIVIIDRGIVNLDTTDVVVIRVVGLQHVVGDVRYVLACVGLSCNVDLLANKVEGLHEVFPESHELYRDVVLISDLFGRTRCSGTEARSNGLIDPYHRGQVHPTIRVLDGGVGAALP